MTEPIKQEIINNIFENGDKLITGPILQTVLIDMIDDVNVKDQEILSKTGSWDDAATQIPNLATKAEVTNLSESVARDLENVVGGDLTGYATEQWVQDQGYLKEHQDISNLATKAELNAAENNLQGNITSLSESVARDLANVSVPEGVATEAWVQSQDYASKSYVDNAVSSSSVDLTGYATETWVQNQGYLTEHQDISNLATKSELNSVSESVQTDISNLATKGELTSVSQSVQTDITNLSESVASSAVWKKGTGTDSIVQAIADGTNLPVATGERAIATGLNTKASGQYSHAEGYGTNASKACSHAEGNGANASGEYSHAEGLVTNASGMASHAEGNGTKASGTFSHAEGYYTIAANQYEHAQGRYNYTSSNQIFSIGAGEYVNGTTNRRNAVSVLAVPNSETQILTSSFFVQNVGGYDGTNPEPGTNDLATVINNLPSGGSSETLWKKGTGEDSLVQKLTGNNEANTSTATGTGAIAIGSQTTASGLYSYAEGDHTVASGTCSHAEGNSTKAEGFNSHAKGYGTKASGMYSNAEGYNAIASGDASHAEGESAEASGWGSHAEGSNTLASGSHSHAEGSSTNASGSYSHAEGTYATASGYYSHAEGDNTKAEGESSHAEGYKASATGRYGHAEGDTSNASGLASHAEGQSTLSSGQSSHAEGFNTIASNDYEHAQGQYNHNSTNQIFSVGAGEKIGETVTRRNAVSILEVPNSDTQVVTASFFVQNVGGYDGTNPTPGTNDLATVINNLPSGGGSSETLWKKGEGQDSIVQVITTDNDYIQPKASGTGSIATGYDTEALGDWSHAEGYSTEASGSYSHAEGHGTVASGEYSHAEGNYTKALGNFGSHAEGRGTEASGWGSHAEGHDTVASEQYSHAEGSDTKASGFYSHAEGGSTVASGFASHAEGMYTTASGIYSHAEGSGTKASGFYSHAEGFYTTASNQCEHAQGRYNHSSENQIFSVGAGESIKDPDTQVVTETRRNAISVLAVDNSGSYTSSFFVQNIGGYDGTNPTPGTNDLATVINNLSSSGGSSSGGSSETIWKKGTGKDSAVLILTGDDEAYTPTATGKGAVATGNQTIASGSWSHAEGFYTKALEWSSHAEGQNTIASGSYSHAEGVQTIASGQASHAEGNHTTASGDWSHAEGLYTVTSNRFEHAQGSYNHSSENQIFSVGAGEIVGTTVTRRNAISVLAVPNSMVLTSSFFVQNVGGYDGTNPLPGTNDLATVLNNTETWTFTLDDGSTVTKNIRIS